MMAALSFALFLPGCRTRGRCRGRRPASPPAGMARMRAAARRQAGNIVERLSRCPPRCKVGDGIGRWRDLHQDSLGRGCELDSALLETLLHAAVELALDRPAAGLAAPDLADDRHHCAIDLVDAPEFEVAADHAAEFRLAAHFVDDVLEDLAGAVGVFLVASIDASACTASHTAGICHCRPSAK